MIIPHVVKTEFDCSIADLHNVIVIQEQVRNIQVWPICNIFMISKMLLLQKYKNVCNI